MKKLIQLNLLLLLISSASVQKSQSQEMPHQQPAKILHVYDWKDLAEQHELSGGEVISMDGTPVLKIEITNGASLSLLKISDSAVIGKACSLDCEIKYENVGSNVRNFLDETGGLQLFSTLPPGALGGDAKLERAYGMEGKTGFIRGSSNWRPCKFLIDRSAFEGLPTQLEMRLMLSGHGTIYIRPIKLFGVVSGWWSPQQSGLIGGIGGSIIGCFGALIGLLASKGKARKFVLAMTKIFIALGILSLIAGGIAAAIKQPYAVYYPLLLLGFILTVVFSVNLPSIQRRYDELEIRRMTSVDV